MVVLSTYSDWHHDALRQKQIDGVPYVIRAHAEAGVVQLSSSLDLRRLHRAGQRFHDRSSVAEADPAVQRPIHEGEIVLQWFKTALFADSALATKSQSGQPVKPAASGLGIKATHELIQREVCQRGAAGVSIDGVSSGELLGR